MNIFSTKSLPLNARNSRNYNEILENIERSSAIIHTCSDLMHRLYVRLGSGIPGRVPGQTRQTRAECSSGCSDGRCAGRDCSTADYLRAQAVTHSSAVRRCSNVGCSKHESCGHMATPPPNRPCEFDRDDANGALMSSLPPRRLA